MTTDTPKTDSIHLDDEIESLEIRYDLMLEHARELERELRDWKDAADNASGCESPDGLRGFIFSLG